MNEMCIDSINELTGQDDRLDLAEIGCHAESELSGTCEALGGKAKRLCIGTGFDLLTRDGMQGALNELVTRLPRYSWFATTCTPRDSWPCVELASTTEKEHEKLNHRQKKGQAALP